MLWRSKIDFRLKEKNYTVEKRIKTGIRIRYSDRKRIMPGEATKTILFTFFFFQVLTNWLIFFFLKRPKQYCWLFLFLSLDNMVYLFLSEAARTILLNFFLFSSLDKIVVFFLSIAAKNNTVDFSLFSNWDKHVVLFSCPEQLNDNSF